MASDETDDVKQDAEKECVLQELEVRLNSDFVIVNGYSKRDIVILIFQNYLKPRIFNIASDIRVL